MSGSGSQHLQMDVRALVPGESDEANLPGFLRLQDGLHRASGGKNAVGIGIANDLVKLEQINSVGLEALQRIIDLTCCSRLVSAVDLRHQECLLPIAVA